MNPREPDDACPDPTTPAQDEGTDEEAGEGLEQAPAGPETSAPPGT